MDKVYVLSSAFDYGRTISPSVGPVYAARMGWPTLPFDVFQHQIEAGRWYVMDNRITESECERLRCIVAGNPDAMILMKVVDPYEEWCRQQLYYQTLFALMDHRNVCFLSVYEPAEVTLDLLRRAGGERMVVIPYPYPAEHEVTAGQKGRCSQILFSGNQHRDVYPYRYRFQRLARWMPGVREYVNILEHPGYPDIGHIQKHDLVGARYIEHLARFRFMFLSPSRCHLEFLKYGECAAAGCVPIGVLPSGLHPAMVAPFIQLDFGTAWTLARSIRRAVKMPLEEAAERALSYRAAMRAQRSTEVLNNQLDAFLSSALDRIYA